MQRQGGGSRDVHGTGTADNWRGTALKQNCLQASQNCISALTAPWLNTSEMGTDAKACVLGQLALEEPHAEM